MEVMDQFKGALDKIGVHYRSYHKSLNIRDCPECGSTWFNLWFKEIDGERHLGGRCNRGSCNKGFTSITYLISMGMSKEDAEKIHGMDTAENLKQLWEMSAISVLQEEEISSQKPDDSQFVNIDPDTYVGKYAIRRGYTDFYNEIIKMDLSTNSVVFLVKREGETIGYQKRFVSPHADPKTQTSTGFTRSCLLFPCLNPIGVLVCEGPFTALSGSHFSFNSLCTFGGNITGRQIKEIVSMVKNGVVYYAKENDEAGEKLLHKFVMAMRWYSIKVLLVLPGTGKDLNDSWQEKTGYKVMEYGLDPWMPRLEWI